MVYHLHTTEDRLADHDNRKCRVVKQLDPKASDALLLWTLAMKLGSWTIERL